MNLINLTPHEITIVPDGGVKTVLPPSGLLARCSEIVIAAGWLDDVPMVCKTYGDVTGLPDPQDDKIYLVSALVRMALPERKDLASPGDLVRNAEGKPVGCKNLVVN